MKPVFIISIVGLFFIAARCQDQSIKSIEFSTVTRGYRKQISVTPDQFIRTVEGRGQDESFQRALSKNEWDAVVSSLSAVKVDSVSLLKSPTSKREFDGALHSTLSINTKKGDSYQHLFDDETPHKSLIPLMEVIKSLDDSSSRK